MPHLSRLLAAICAVTFLSVSLPVRAGIGDKDLPLLNGEKTMNRPEFFGDLAA
jgi:hypothetical protein